MIYSRNDLAAMVKSQSDALARAYTEIAKVQAEAGDFRAPSGRPTSSPWRPRTQRRPVPWRSSRASERRLATPRAPSTSPQERAHPFSKHAPCSE